MQNSGKNYGPLMIGCGGFLVLVLFAAIWFGMFMGQRNTAISLEEDVKAQYRSNKSSYDTMWKKIVEMTQVTELQAEHFKEVYTGLITGRYQDTQLLFKMVQEQNPQLNQNVYSDLMREIAAGRENFNNQQRIIQDKVREYNTYVQKHFIMAALTGRKPLNYDDYLVTSERTSNAFETKKDEPINIMPSNRK